MSKVKTMLAMGALLIGAAYAELGSESSATTSATGDYITTVDDVAKVWLSKEDAATANAKDILLTGSDVSTSPLVLEFTVLTNRDEWDLSLSAANNGSLLRTTDGMPLKTDAVGDGKLGNGGSLYVVVTDVEYDEDHSVTTNLEKDDAAEISVASIAPSLATALGKTENTFTGTGLVKSVFEIKAGLRGTKIIAPPGTYKETVTLSFTSNAD